MNTVKTQYVRLGIFAMMARVVLVAAAASAAETVIEIGEKELQVDCIPMGMNMQSERFLKSPVIANFEGYMIRRMLNESVVYPDGIRSYQSANAKTEDERQKLNSNQDLIGATANVLSGPAKGQKRIITAVETRNGFTYHSKDEPCVFYKFDKPLEGVTEPLPKNQNEPPMGILVEKRLLNEGVLSSVENADKLSPEAYALVHDDLPPGTSGKTALKLQPAKGGSLQFQGHQPLYTDCNRVYTVRFWGKGMENGAKVAIKLTLSQKTLASTEVALGKEWKQHELRMDLTGKVDNTASIPFHTFLMLDVSAAGAAVLIDEIELRGEGYKNPTPYVDEVMASMKDLHPGVVRAIRVDGDGLETHLLAPMQHVAMSRTKADKGWQRSGRPKISEFLPMCEYLGTEPWYNIPGSIHVDEIDFLMEYLGAPANVGYGKVRAAQGHPEPWLKSFHKVHIEFGNEVWNFGGGFNGQDFWKDMIERAKKSPYYKPNLMFHPAGMWSGSLNLRILKQTPNADSFAIAPYIGHTYPENVRQICPTPDDRARWAVGLGLTKNIYSTAMTDQINVGRKMGIHFSLYEMNHHLITVENDGAQRFGARPKPTMDLINEYVPSQIAGIAVANNMLAMLREHGIREQCFFNYNGEFFGIKLWGGALRVYGTDPRYRPTWLALTAANRGILEKMVETKHTGERPVFQMPPMAEKANREIPAVKGDNKGEFDSLWSYAFTQGAERSVILVNVDVKNPATVKLRLNGKPAAGATLWRVTGKGPHANNELENGEAQVFLKEDTLGTFADGYGLTLEPATMTVLRWRVTQ